jgi:hypothetical protein
MEKFDGGTRCMAALVAAAGVLLPKTLKIVSESGSILWLEEIWAICETFLRGAAW